MELNLTKGPDSCLQNFACLHDLERFYVSSVVHLLMRKMLGLDWERWGYFPSLEPLGKTRPVVKGSNAAVCPGTTHPVTSVTFSGRSK